MMVQYDYGKRLYRWVWLCLWVGLVGCGYNPLLPTSIQMYEESFYDSTKDYDDFDSFVAAMDTPDKVNQWLYYYTEYHNDYNGGWLTKDRDQTRKLAKYLFDNRKGRCAQYAAVYVYCASYHGYQSGFIVTQGHCWGWIVEEGGVSLTSARSNKRTYKKHRYSTLGRLYETWKTAMILNSYYEVINRDERI